MYRICIITGNIVWKTVSVVHITLCGAGILYLLILVIEHLTKRVVNPLEHEEGRYATIISDNVSSMRNLTSIQSYSE